MIKQLLFISLLLLAFTGHEVFGQKLKSGAWKITIERWEEQQVDFFGKKQIGYVAILKVEKDKKEFGTYRTYLIRLNDTLKHLAVYEGSTILEPRLYWNETDKSFTYKRGTPEEATIVTEKNADTKEITLSGMLIWLKQLK